MKILVIEKDARLTKNLKINLERENFVVDIIEESGSAFRRLMSYGDQYDLVILNLTLPDGSGIDLCRNLRENSIKIPLLVISTQNSIEERIRALDNGADDYVIHPFSISDLRARIRAILRRPADTVPEVIRLGATEFKIHGQRVYKNGKEIPLTPKEFSIFEYLIRHPNQVVSRDQIIDNAWAFDFNSLSNVIDVHVKNLRKKISGSHSKNNDLIETIWGFGYKLKSGKDEKGGNMASGQEINSAVA